MCEVFLLHVQVIGFQKNSTITAPLNDVRLLGGFLLYKESVADTLPTVIEA